MLNYLHIEFISQSTIWSVALLGTQFILYFILHLLCPIPTLAFIYFISNCMTTAIESYIKPVDVKTAISTAGTERGSGLHPYRDTAVQQS